MKKAFSILFLSILFLLSFGFVSAYSSIINGTVYQGDITNGISGATVEVTCHHTNGPGRVQGDYTQSTITDSNGRYSIIFPWGWSNLRDGVTIRVWENGLSGAGSGSINTILPEGLPDCPEGSPNCVECEHPYQHCDSTFLGTINVELTSTPLVPEFRLITGITAILGALGTFFVIRRK